MAVVVSISSQPGGGIDNTENQFIVDGTLTLSGNYGGGATHGDTIQFESNGIDIPSSQPPNRVEIYEAPTAGNAPTGYNFIYAQGTTPNNGLLIVTQGANGAPSTEITQGAGYPAALTAAGANIRFRAWFPSFL